MIKYINAIDTSKIIFIFVNLDSQAHIAKKNCSFTAHNIAHNYV